MTSAEGREEVVSGGQKVLQVGVRPRLLEAPGYASGLEQEPAPVLLALPPGRAVEMERRG
jgi:hypothetical protein